MAYGSKKFAQNSGVVYVSYFTRNMEEEVLYKLRHLALEKRVTLEEAFNEVLKLGLDVLQSEGAKDDENPPNPPRPE